MNKNNYANFALDDLLWAKTHISLHFKMRQHIQIIGSWCELAKKHHKPSPGGGRGVTVGSKSNINCKVRKFDDLKKYVGRVIALDVNMVNFNKILTSFKNVIFYVYFDMNLPEKLYVIILGSFKVS